MSTAKLVDQKEDKNLVWANIFTDQKEAPLWEQGMITLWFLLTFVEFPGTTPLLYLLVLAMVGQFVLDKDKTIPVLLKASPVFLLPVFGIISFIWSPHPADAIRSGVLMTLTPLTILVIATRMDLRHALRCLMFAGWIATILIVPNLGTDNNIHQYGSRNLLAMQVTFMMLLSLTSVLNPRELPWVRWAALPFVPLGIYIVVDSGSATSLVFTVLGPIALILSKLFWVETARVQYLRPMVLVLAMMMVIGSVLVLLSLPSVDFEGKFLELVGRERNLSGRTTIWEAGRVIQDQHPILGTGLAGFWNSENGAAQSINFYDFKPYGTALTFHSAFMEARVHLGWVGYWLFVLSWVWCFFRIIKTWLQSHHMEASLVLVAALASLASTTTESITFLPFKTPSNLLFLGAIATLAASRKRFVGRVPVVINAETRELRALST